MAAGDFDLQWPTEDDITITLASLASDSNLLAGRVGTVIVASAEAFVIDYLLSGNVRVGTSPTGGVIEQWVYAQIDDTPTYPDGIGGSDANKTITSTNVKNVGLRLAGVAAVGTTSDRDYPFAPVSVASLFGGILPVRFGVFIVHSTGVNLNSTGSNHYMRAAPVYLNAAAS